jgi:hypothetical protein
LALGCLHAGPLRSHLTTGKSDLCFERGYLSASLAQLQFIRHRINDQERSASLNILVIGYEDLNDASADFRRHRRAVGKYTRIMCSRASVNGENDEDAESDRESDSDCRN